MNSTKRSKGTVRFVFKDTKKKLEENKNQESLIMLHFNFGLGKRFKYSTGYKSCYNDWDFIKQRVRNKTAILNRDKTNGFLNELETFIVQEYSDLCNKKTIVTAELLKDRLDIFTEKKVEKDCGNSFFEIIERYINERKGHITLVTERSYRQTKKRLEAFEKQSKEKLNFDKIDMNFYYRFNAFMEKEGYSLNTIGKHIKSIKTFVNYALSEGYTTNNKINNKNFKANKELTTEIYLSESEIQEMFDMDLSKYPEMERARDIFLIGCFTGQRVSDYNYLTKNDIVELDGIKYFKIKQKKNRKHGRVVMCPITKEIREIMDKRHNGGPPASMPEPMLNENIKQVGKDLGWQDLVKCESTKGGKVISDMVPKYQLIKTHTARRSFCTNKYKAGMSVFDIMLFSGHSTEKEFYKYIRIQGEERASHVAKSGFFNL